MTTATMRRNGRFDPAPAMEIAARLARSSGWRHSPIDSSTSDSLANIAAQMGVSSRQVSRWRKDPGVRMTVATADRVAMALGRHPGEIWPEWWTA